MTVRLYSHNWHGRIHQKIFVQELTNFKTQELTDSEHMVVLARVNNIALYHFFLVLEYQIE